MSPQSSQAGRHLLDGTIRAFLAGLLFPLTGIVTAAFLTRRLGPEGYGLLVLAATLTTWLDWAIASFFARATIKSIGERDDWQHLGSTLIRMHLFIGVAVGLLLGMLGGPLSRLLNEPVMSTYLWYCALGIPFSSLAQAHQNILIGIGSFREKAKATAGRWIARLVLILLLVELGLSVPGAILGGVGASVAEFILSRRYVRPSFFGKATNPGREFWGSGFLLFLSALCLNCYWRLDLIMLKAIGGTAGEAGIYGAAQNLSILPGILATSFTPLMLATLSRMLSSGDRTSAKAIANVAMRMVCALLPFAAMVAGSSLEIVTMFFGRRYAGAAPVLSLLIIGAIAYVMISVAVTIITAAGAPRLALLMTLPLIPFAAIGHLVLIPRFEGTGAALVTMGCAILSALACVVAVHRMWSIIPPAGTVWRSLGISVLAYGIAASWQVSSLMLVPKLSVIAGIIVFAFYILREFDSRETEYILSLFRSARKRPDVVQQTS